MVKRTEKYQSEVRGNGGEWRRVMIKRVRKAVREKV